MTALKIDISLQAKEGNEKKEAQALEDRVVTRKKQPNFECIFVPSLEERQTSKASERRRSRRHGPAYLVLIDKERKEDLLT